MRESRVVQGCCPLDCQDTCCWVAHVEDGRVVRVEGAKAHPFTRGALCAKVDHYEERTYAPDRILTPLRRTGPKGDGALAPTTWADAIADIASRFRAIIDRHGAEALLPINYLGSMGVVQRRALMRVFHALGASRFHGSICGASSNAIAAEGHPRGFDPEELVDARLVLLWGANLLSTSHHHWHVIAEARKRHGTRIVCIDPRLTRTARAGDEHLSIVPGSDTALAAALAHVMLAEGLADRAYASAVAEDLDAFERQVAPWTPARAESVCGVPADRIVSLAREFAQARPAVIRCGIAPQQTAGGEAFVRALSALTILGGHWRHRGGGLFMEANPTLNEGAAARPDLLPRDSRSLDLARLGEHLTSDTLEPPVMGLMVWGTNPAVVQPDATRVRHGLARDDLFTVVVEHFLTDTARFADIVLPSTTQLEHFDIVGAWGHHYISVNHPAIAPLGDSQSHGEIMRRLAAALGLRHPALRESDEEIAASALPAGIDLAVLKGRGWIKTQVPRPDLVTSGVRLRLAGGVPLPPPRAAHELQLLTPKSHYFLNSSFANQARHRRAMRRPTLEMHPADAAPRGVPNDARVEIRNAQGSIAAWARVTDEVREGVVVLTGKWWGVPPETGAVANLLTPSRWSPGGQPAYNETFVEVVPAPAAAGGDVPSGGEDATLYSRSTSSMSAARS